MKNLDEIYFAARELPSADRPDFLAQACTGDEELQKRVQQMLAVSAEAEAFITDLPDDESEDRTSDNGSAKSLKLDLADAPDEAVGQTLGRYKLLERVGEGGCGVVYVAEQTEPVRRRVALKVIKLGMDTKQVVARFEAERQALAMMDHPNIAKVLDAGTTDVGRPFFVMELVRGIRITDHCDQANLTTKERLDLFIKVCQAIQHAHQKGIIHRDIKPSNILVTLHDGVPVPKVIDFGIAKATEGRLTDNTVYTQLHQFIGTPAYMSPEQAEMSGLDIDTRSDIYSLGVLLYELLAGSTPFDAKELMSSGIDAMRKTIREQEPMSPSTRFATLQGDELTTVARRRSADAPKLIDLLKGDLDWIVMKCMEKDRTRRYETANGLAADLNRHLTNEPVVARRPTTAYRLQKAFRRHRLAFTATATVTAALLIGIVMTTWQAVRATRAERDRVKLQRRLDDYASQKKQAVGNSQTNQTARVLSDHPLALKDWGRGGSRPKDYTMGLDDSTTLDGQTVAFIKSKEPRIDGFGTFMQTFKSKDFLGNGIRLSARIKAESIEGAAVLWMRVDGPNGEILLLDNMLNRPIKGTRDWAQYEIELYVSNRAKAIAAGLLVSGTGQAWISDVKFTVVPEAQLNPELLKDTGAPPF